MNVYVGCRSKIRFSLRMLLPLILLTVLSSGCGDDGRPIPPPPDLDPLFYPRTSPEDLLFNLRGAYRSGGIAVYESLLALEDPAFTFLLSEYDAGQPGMRGMPDSWGRSQEIAIHRNIFDSEQVEGLTLTFNVGNREWDAENEMWSILVSNINLCLRGIVPGREEEGLQWLKVENATSRFWFKENSWTQPGTGDKVWTIVKWQEDPSTLSRDGESLSWGRIKALFR